ncbi:MAG: rRNA maturation RNase YbeY [Candidatus Omnitrophota bacterium]
MKGKREKERIEVRFDAGAKGIRGSWVRNIVARTLNAEKAQRRSVSVFLTNNKAIRKLNKRFLNHDYPTDVISFRLSPFPFNRDFLGDLVVSVQTAKAVSKKLRIPFREELARYLVHGVLHLLGYEDGTKKDKIKMEGRQEFILRKYFG